MSELNAVCDTTSSAADPHIDTLRELGVSGPDGLYLTLQSKSVLF